MNSKKTFKANFKNRRRQGMDGSRRWNGLLSPALSSDQPGPANGGEGGTSASLWSQHMRETNLSMERGLEDAAGSFAAALHNFGLRSKTISSLFLVVLFTSSACFGSEKSASKDKQPAEHHRGWIGGEFRLARRHWNW